jgi:TetR/AcrR family transcriptional regulator
MSFGFALPTPNLSIEQSFQKSWRFNLSPESERHVATFLDAVEQLNSQQLSSEEALKQMIRAAVAHELTYPNEGKILLHEAMQNEGKHFKLTGWEVPIGLGMKLLQQC